MLAYYIEWHLKHELTPLLLVDEHKDKAKEKRNTPIVKAKVSDSAIKKQNTGTTEDVHPANRFATMMKDPRTFTLNEVSPTENPVRVINLMSPATEVLQTALELIGVDEKRCFY